MTCTIRGFDGDKGGLPGNCQKAITHIGEKDVIYLTTSLTGYYMACSLPEDFPFTVVTNSVTNANELRKHQNISVILMGGDVAPGTLP